MMSGLAFQIDPLQARGGGYSAGTQFAANTDRTGEQTRPGRYRMAAKLAILAAAVLAITPAAVTIALPEGGAAEPQRSVSITGPILDFTQSHDRIQVRLKPAASETERDARKRVIIRDAEGDEMTISLKRGQTWASTELTADLASADALEISVD
jgi:hypothetical protein